MRGNATDDGRRSGVICNLIALDRKRFQSRNRLLVNNASNAPSTEPCPLEVYALVDDCLLRALSSNPRIARSMATVQAKLKTILKQLSRSKERQIVQLLETMLKDDLNMMEPSSTCEQDSKKTLRVL
ncbi:hypothetical protein Ae201684P_018751 [Aphanomyces euteiches]|nr:hypothetical protein Ae201684P_018751 [Aphanomyces euteiches]